MMLDIKVTLRINSNKFGLSEISKQLQHEPDYGFSIGDKYARDRRTREHSLWSIDSKRPCQDKFEQHIIEILAFLDKKETAIHQLKQDCSIDLFCYLGTENGQGGAVLSAQLCHRVSQYGLNIVLDVHATCENN